MLLQHAWLAPVAKPATIMEEDEEAAEAAAEAEAAGEAAPASTDEAGGVGGVGADAKDGFHDREVGEWVLAALDRRRRGVMGKAAKPALHAAPLDTAAAVASEVGSPVAVA